MTPISKQLTVATAAASALAAVTALAAAPANAKVHDHFSFHFSAQESFDDCGFTIDDDLTFDGQNVIRTVKGTQTLSSPRSRCARRGCSPTPRTAGGSA